MVSERVILDHFWGLGKGHLWEFGLPEAGPDLGSCREPKSSDSSREALANSRSLHRLVQLLHELLPHTP